MPSANAASFTSVSTSTSQPEPQAPAHKPLSGLPHRSFSSISISPTEVIKPIQSLENNEIEPLTQERLEELWHKLIENCKDDDKMHELIADKKVVLKSNNLFQIQVPNLYFDTQLRNYQTQILSFLRNATGNDALKYEATVVVEQTKARAYLPREKFDEMSSRNPSMLTLRKLFPDIDF